MAFWRMFGGCTTTYGDLCWPAGLEATRLTLGDNTHNAPWDLVNARLIIFWGKNAAETNVHQMAFVDDALDRGARLIGDRLDAVLIVQPSPRLPPRDWLTELFAKEALDPVERSRVLRGTPPKGQFDAGQTVCSCFSVGINTLTQAIHNHDLRTPEEIGELLQAGTNCGSCLPELRRLIADV